MKYLIIVIAAIALSSCAFWKPAVKTVNQVARLLCIEAYGDPATTAMTAEDWCNVHENLYPFIEAVTSAQAGAQAGATSANNK